MATANDKEIYWRNAQLGFPKQWTLLDELLRSCLHQLLAKKSDEGHVTPR
jgi:hypothetical protein